MVDNLVTTTPDLSELVTMQEEIAKAEADQARIAELTESIAKDQAILDTMPTTVDLEDALDNYDKGVYPIVDEYFDELDKLFDLQIVLDNAEKDFKTAKAVYEALTGQGEGNKVADKYIKDDKAQQAKKDAKGNGKATGVATISTLGLVGIATVGLVTTGFKRKKNRH